MELFISNLYSTDKVLYWVHGGGFQLPLVNLYRKAAVRISKELKMHVALVDYRVYPH